MACTNCGEYIDGRAHHHHDEPTCDDCWFQMCREEVWCPGCGKPLPSKRWAMCRDCGRDM